MIRECFFRLQNENEEEGSKKESNDGDSGYIKLKVLGNVSMIIRKYRIMFAT